MDQLKRIICSSILNKNYFKIVRDVGFDDLYRIYKPSPHFRAFNVIRKLYERYGSFDLVIAANKAGGEIKEIINHLLLEAKCDQVCVEDAEALSSSVYSARLDSAEIIKEEIVGLLDAFNNNEMIKINEAIKEKLLNDPMASLADIMTERDALMRKGKKESKMKEWRVLYQELENEIPEEEYYLGIDCIDEHVPIYRGNILTLAGSPGAGKTTLANKFVIDNLHKPDRPMSAIYFSLETNAKRTRQTFDQYMINGKGMKWAEVSEWHENASLKFNSEMTDINDIIDEIHINYETNPNLRLIVIDYVQLLGDREIGVKQFEVISSAMKKLTSANLKWQCVIVLLSQLSVSEYRGDREPTLASLKGSGQIAENSSYVMILHKENDATMESCGAAKVKAKLVKCRFASPKNWDVIFVGKARDFVEAEQ